MHAECQKGFFEDFDESLTIEIIGANSTAQNLELHGSTRTSTTARSSRRSSPSAAPSCTRASVAAAAQARLCRVPAGGRDARLGHRQEAAGAHARRPRRAEDERDARRGEAKY